MRHFTHYDAKSIGEACELLSKYQGKAKVNAGGTDLITVLHADILWEYPEVLINLKTVPDLDYIREDSGYLHIGAMTTLDAISRSSLVRERCLSLAQASQAVASPQIRNTGTLGGNICQETRCWYFRYPARLGGGPLPCPRKGCSGACLAVAGDNRYHAVLGAKRCFAVCHSDTAVALAALDAQLVIISRSGERRVAVSEFYHPLGNVLNKDEFIREIVIPLGQKDEKQCFIKYATRKAIDFAVCSVASSIKTERDICTNARIAIGAIAAFPVRAIAAEKIMVGRVITDELLNDVAEAALVGARPLSMNAYKIKIAKTLVKQSIIDAIE